MAAIWQICFENSQGSDTRLSKKKFRLEVSSARRWLHMIYGISRQICMMIILVAAFRETVMSMLGGRYANVKNKACISSVRPNMHLHKFL